MKNKAATDGGERRAQRGVRRPLFAQDDDEVFVTGSTLCAGQEVKPPGHNPLGHNPRFLLPTRTSWDRTRRVFFVEN